MSMISMRDIPLTVVNGIKLDDLRHIEDEYRRLGNTYHWKPPTSANQRRSEERRNSHSWTFDVDNKPVICTIQVGCTCHNYYVTRLITYDGKHLQTYIPFLKKCIRVLTTQLKGGE